MRQFIVDVNLSAEQMRAYYAGKVGQVQARDPHGIRVVFPAACLRRFVTHVGVCGRFALTVDQHNRLVGVARVH